MAARMIPHARSSHIGTESLLSESYSDAPVLSSNRRPQTNMGPLECCMDSGREGKFLTPNVIVNLNLRS